MDPKGNAQHPPVSVVITCYNYGRFLRECIESVLAQTFRELEIIVVNDGSTDDTEAVCESFKGTIRYHVQSNRGVAEALNAGIRLSRGDFFYFLSADDKLFPDTVERQMEVMRADQTCAVVCGNAKMIDENGRFIGDCNIAFPEKKRLLRMLGGPNLHDGSLLFRRTSLEKINSLYFAPSLGNYHLYHYKCFLLAKEFKIRYLDHFLVYQRVHSSNLSHPNHVKRMIAGYEILRKEMRKHVTVFDLFEGINKECPEEIAKAYYKLGMLFFLFGQYEIAYADFKKALDLDNDIFEKKVDVSELNFGHYVYPLPEKCNQVQDEKTVKAVERDKGLEAEKIFAYLAQGNVAKAFFVCKKKLEAEPNDSETKYLLAKTYLRQLQFHDSVNRFHDVTLELLKEVHTADPLHSVDLYLWLGLFDEERKGHYFNELSKKIGRLKFYDLKEMAWAATNAKALGKTEWLESARSIFNPAAPIPGPPKDANIPCVVKSSKRQRGGKKRILLVNPPYRRFLALEAPCFPLSFGIMATLLEEQGYEVGIYDADYDQHWLGKTGSYEYALRHQSRIREALKDRKHVVWSEIKKVIQRFAPDIVGISAMSNKYPMVECIAEITKSIDPNIPVVIGGHHPSIFGEKLIRNRNIDFGVRGEGEMTMHELVHRYFSPDRDLSGIQGLIYKERGEIRTNPPRELIQDLDLLPIPNRDLILNDHYASGNNVMTARGCPFHCSYCGARTIWGRKVRRRSVAGVLKEIHGLIQRSGSRDISFWDDSFTCERSYLEDLMRELRMIDGLSFSCITRIDLVDKGILGLLREAGCNQILFGIESGSDRILKSIQKGLSKDFIKKKVEEVNSFGIPWLGFFIMGYPGETREDILETLCFMKELDPPLAEINLFNPLPGTPIWKELENKGLVHRDMDFSQYSQSSLKNHFLSDLSQEDYEKLAFQMAQAFDAHNRRKRGEAADALGAQKTELSVVSTPKRGENPSTPPRPASGYSHAFPKQAHFLMIDKCNAKCIMCGGDYYRSISGRMITLEAFKRMASNLRLEHFDQLVLSGAGEPLLSPWLIPIVEYVNTSYPKVEIAITTNGIALSTELAEKLLAHRIDSINFSINAASREVYRRVMQVDCFERVCRNARDFLQLRNSRSMKTVVQFSMALHRLNIEDLPRLVEIGGEIGIDRINVMYCRFYPDRIRHLNVDRIEDRLLDHESLFFHQELSDRLVKAAKETARQKNIAFHHEPLFGDRSEAPLCRWPFSEIMVGFDGEIYPCGGAEVHFREKVAKGVYHFGNALKESIENFWNEESYRLLRQSCQMEERGPISECECCANRMNPNEKRAHLMDWDDPEEGKGEPEQKRIAGLTKEEIRLKNPLVSVIVPTHNRPAMLRDALQSIFSQTFQDFEVIVVNDAGQDVEHVVKSFNSSKTKYLVHESNKGLAAARNTGIRAARGKYIAYLDDDDIFYSAHLATLVNHLELTGSPVAYTDAYRAFRADGPSGPRIIKRDIPYSFDFDRKRLLISNYIPVLCFMHTREAAADAGLFDEALTSHEDWDLWVRMSRHCRFDHIQQVTCEFRWCSDGSTMTSAKRSDYLKTARSVYRKIQESENLEPDVIQKQEAALLVRRCEIQGISPQVMCSVIIPVYNQLAYTRRCIETLFKNTPAPLYELVVVDNASTDGTGEFLQAIRHPKQIITNDQNKGFTIACNQGASVAKGKYLVFLNNDTEPQKEWLTSLVAVAEADLLVGAVGSKLVYPNGMLQEAGAMILHDAANRGVGYKDNPDKPEYNRLYEVDYCSAASLLVRHDLFKEVGGFDERYAPAYYEDPDLCFALKTAGYKTVYNHRSVVVHHESATAGPGSSSGVKRHYWINRKKFYEKWKDYLLEKPSSHRPYDPGCPPEAFETPMGMASEPKALACRGAGRVLADSANDSLRGRVDKICTKAGKTHPPAADCRNLPGGKGYSGTIVIDGVIFQMQRNRPHGISRLWHALLRELSTMPRGRDILLLDRDGTAPEIPGIRRRRVTPFSLRDPEKQAAFLDAVCREEAAVLFASTYYSHTERTPSVLMLYDMIYEWVFSNRAHPATLKGMVTRLESMAKKKAIRNACAYMAISHATAGDFRKHYPEAMGKPVAIVPCAVSDEFRINSANEIASFCDGYGISRPYFLLVGRRAEYKNALLFLKAFKQMPGREKFQVVMAGGEKELDPESRMLLADTPWHIRFFSDRELSLAYSGATALVYPSLCEGFGLPLLEAMQSGCPVITCRTSSMPEVAGQAALYLEQPDERHMLRALELVQQPGVRKIMIERGLHQAGLFSWQRSAALFCETLDSVVADLSQADVRPTSGIPGGGLKPEVQVSAIVSVYNSERFVRGCLQDLVDQTLFKKGLLEIIVVDSASPQQESKIVKEFQDRHPNIACLRTEQRETLYQAWNRGVRAARGKYVTSANSDDRHRRDALERMRQALDQRPEIGLVYADVIKTETENETFDRCTPTGRYRWYDWDRNLLLTEGCFMGPQPMWRKSVHEVYGEFDESLVASGDFEFWLRISQTFDFYHIREPLGLYLVSPDSLEHRNGERKRSEDLRILSVYRRAASSGEILRCIPLDGLKQALCHTPRGSPDRLEQMINEVETLASANQHLQNDPTGIRRSGAIRLSELKRQILQSPTPADGINAFVNCASALILNQTSWFARYRENAETRNGLVFLPSATPNPDADGKLSRLRSELAQFWLRAPVSDLARLYCGEAGNLQREFIFGRFKGLPLSRDDIQASQGVLDRLAGGLGEEGLARFLLVAMLYRSPQQLPPGIDLLRVPEWLCYDYTHFLLTCSGFLQEPGESEAYFNCLDQLTGCIRDAIRREPQSPIWQGIALLFAEKANFIPLYFSRKNLKEIYARRAEIVDYTLRVRECDFDYAIPQRPKNRRKLRLGIHCRALRPHTEIFATLPVFEYLDREKFEIFFYAHFSCGGSLEERVRRTTDKFTVLPEAINPCADIIRADDLDILFFGNNITAVQNQSFALANYRMARIQCIHFCNPVTSGKRHIDYFLLGELIAGKQDLKERFAEKVLTIDGAGICFDIPKLEDVPEKRLSRMGLKIENARTVFVSGANCCKIIPELRHTWARIMKQVPDSVLVLYPFGPAWSDAYPKQLLIENMHRVFAGYGLLPNQLVVLDTLGGDVDILALNRIADVYLDAVPYNGATSLLEPLQAGTPPVVVDGCELRFSQGAAMLKELGINELIAGDEEDYVRIAVRLGTNACLREAMRGRIQRQMAAGPDFLNPRRYAQRIGKAFGSLFLDSDRRSDREVNFKKADISAQEVTTCYP